MSRKKIKVNELTLRINEKLFPLLSSKGIDTIYKLSKSIGENAGSLSKIKRGLSSWTAEQLEKIRLIHGISLDALFGDENRKKPEQESKNVKFQKVPMLGYAECGSPAAVWNEFAIKYFDLADAGNLINPFILTAKGDSMHPFINSGDKLLCSEHTDKIKNNSFVVAVFKSMPETFEANAKLINWDRKNKLITLYSINTKYPPTNHREDEFIKIYKLNRIIRDIK
jgi:phage repressor protein C with HTH and peptisase S24 domain